MAKFLKITLIIFLVIFLTPILIFIYHSASDNYYYNIAPPKPAWIFKFDTNSSYSTNLLFKDRLIAADDENLYAINPKDGKLIWKYHFPDNLNYDFIQYNSNPGGLVLVKYGSEPQVSVVLINPNNGKELKKLSGDFQALPYQYPLEFNKVLDPYRAENPQLALEFSYKKPGELNIYTPKDNYIHEMCRGFICIDTYQNLFFAQDSKIGWVKWKYQAESFDQLNGNAEFLFIIKKDGVYAYPHI